MTSVQVRATVAQVVPHLGVGGMQRMALLLDELLPGAGVSSTMVDLHALREERSTPVVWRSLVRRWRADGPDAVLAHSVLAGLFTLTAALVAGVGRRVLVVHASRQSLGSTKSSLVALLAATRIATDVVVCGTAATASFGRWLPVLARRAVAIPNAVASPGSGGAAPREELPAVRDRADEPLRVLVVGRLVRDKRVDVAVRAVAGSRARLTVCGEGPDAAVLARLARDTGGEVTFLGEVPGDRMAEVYRSHAVLAFPSEVEGLPLVLLEAASHGLAVVAADRPFNREVLGDAGWFCGSDDPAEWRAAFDSLATDEVGRRRLAVAALDRVPLFDLGTMVDRYADLVTSRS